MDVSPVYTHVMHEKLNPDIREILRYMGCGKEANDQVMALAQQARDMLCTAIAPKACYCILPLKRISDTMVDISLCTLHSASFAKYTGDADRAIMFAATIGMEADRAIMRAQHSKPSLALALQAAGAATIERYCDYLCSGLFQTYANQEKLWIGHRFSAGYGDVKLEYQKKIFELLDCQRKIGLTLTDGMMMLPSKSVTAFVKMQKQENCMKHNCDICNQTSCQFRRG